jgi:hypothetical protein
MGARNRLRLFAFALASLFAGQRLGTCQQSQPPAGEYQCRNWDSQPYTTLQATFTLHGDGKYEATDQTNDLNSNRPSTTGRYTYDKSNQRIDWISGKWQDRFGSYMPHVKGDDFIVIHTKRDPEGKGDGGLRCVRTSPPQ